MSVIELLDSAMQLSAADRAALATGLIDSLDSPAGEIAAVDDWSETIASRVADVRSGRVPLVSWEQATAMVRSDERPDV